MKLLLLPFFLLFTREIVAFHCPNGSQQMPNEDVCVFFVNTTLFYYNVIRQCYALGAVPAKVQNIFENAYLFAMLQADGSDLGSYIGVERTKDNIWTYADGTPLTYQNWAPNEPNNASNSSVCTIMSRTTGQWFSADCTIARPFLCSINGNEFQCPDGWVYNATFDYCYYLQNFTYTDGVHWQLYDWTAAETNCQRMGSHLVSIHSKAEDEFVYNLVTSNVINLTIAAPNKAPCYYHGAWIGYYGNGTLGTGTWSDGTQVDYVGVWTSGLYYWLIANDMSCGWHQWYFISISDIRARFVCKMPSKNRVAKEKLKKS